MGVSEIMAIVLVYISVDSILLDPAVPGLFYCKRDVAACDVIIFIRNPDLDNISDAILVLS